MCLSLCSTAPTPTIITLADFCYTQLITTSHQGLCATAHMDLVSSDFQSPRRDRPSRPPLPNGPRLRSRTKNSVDMNITYLDFSLSPSRLPSMPTGRGSFIFPRCLAPAVPATSGRFFTHAYDIRHWCSSFTEFYLLPSISLVLAFSNTSSSTTKSHTQVKAIGSDIPCSSSSCASAYSVIRIRADSMEGLAL
jgi:hypothetical protein